LNGLHLLGRCFAIGVAWFVVGVPVAAAQDIDARTLGTAGSPLGRPTGDLRRVNPALYAAPTFEPPGEASIPLPIGLLNADFPTLESSDDDFDLIAIADFLWNIPWNLQFGAPEEPSGDVTIRIALDELVIDLRDAKTLVPTEGFAAGGRHSLMTVGNTFDLGARYGTFRLDLFELFVIDDLSLEIDDALQRVLRDAEPVVGGRTYGLDARGVLQTGFTMGLAYAREIPLGRSSARATGDDWLDRYWETERDRPRLWVGAGLRRYFGVSAVDLRTRVDMKGQDPLFGNDGSFTTGLSADLLQGALDGIEGWGRAWGIDLGTLLRWRAWEVGAGVADLGAEMTWDRGRIQRYDFDSERDAFANEVVAEDVRIETPIPTTWRIDVTHRTGATRTVTASIDNGAGDTAYRLAAEEWIRPWFAVRGGVVRDPRGLFQIGTGIGLRKGPVGFDLGIRTHARNVRGNRVGELGLSLVLNPIPRGGP